MNTLNVDTRSNVRAHLMGAKSPRHLLAHSQKGTMMDIELTGCKLIVTKRVIREIDIAIESQGVWSSSLQGGKNDA